VPADIPFTVRSIVEMGRHPHRHDPPLTKADDRRAVEEAMLRTGVGELAERVYATLSSGERLRVFLARVLAQEAPIVLLDEPTANLDVGHSETVLAEAKALSRASHTVVSVFHDLNAAAFYCDRICLLAEGRCARRDRCARSCAAMSSPMSTARRWRSSTTRSGTVPSFSWWIR
jgi:iron complex transport system ATP-binding protein